MYFSHGVVRIRTEAPVGASQKGPIPTLAWPATPLFRALAPLQAITHGFCDWLGQELRSSCLSVSRFPHPGTGSGTVWWVWGGGHAYTGGR